MIEKEKKKLILETIQNKTPNLRCPMCNHNQFSIMDGYFKDFPQANLNEVVYDNKQSIPSIIIICNYCGFMSHHSLGALGLLDSMR